MRSPGNLPLKEYAEPLAAATTRPRGIYFFLMGGRIGKELSLELTIQEEVEVPGGSAASFLGVGTAFQNVGRGNNAPC